MPRTTDTHARGTRSADGIVRTLGEPPIRRVRPAPAPAPTGPEGAPLGTPFVAHRRPRGRSHDGRRVGDACVRSVTLPAADPAVDLGRRARAARDGCLAFVVALTRALDERDPSTHAHSSTVARLAAATATRMGYRPERVEEIRVGGLLHDVGKVGVSDAVLRKRGALTPEEWDEMRRHPQIGANLLTHPGLTEIREWVLCHHERPDGLGYPRGLTRAEIPDEALIIAVADAYEAMVADRPYRRALTDGEARAELEGGRDTQFDGRIVSAFLASLDAGRAGRECPAAAAATPPGA